MFESTPLNPPDAIFGLIEEFKSDPNDEKINLTVGMYQDESGKTPVMQSVQAAKRTILENGQSHIYLPIAGLGSFNDLIPALIFGVQHQAVTDDLAFSAQTPGGTAALRIAGEMLSTRFGVKKIWMSQPTWANHSNIFPAAGLEIKNYRYLDANGTGVDFDSLLASLEPCAANDAILLHTVCHNPTGIDLTAEQWEQVFDVIDQKKLIPIFDFAYQGFGDGVEQDAAPIRKFCKRKTGAIICSSFSKNFNLYGERVGAITVFAGNSDDAKAVLSQAKAVIRANYSNPPTFGGAIVSTVFHDDSLKAQWLTELEEIRLRICELRQRFVAAIGERLPSHDFSHINRQRGMFSYSGISGDVVERLKHEHSIYLLKSGRINVAGINSKNIDRLCDGIAAVLSNSEA